jgi:hypothetical protein
MGLRKLTLSSVLGLAAALTAVLTATAPAAQAQTAYAIANGGSTLISFNVANPTAILSSVTINIGGSTVINIGGQPTLVGLDGIDFRPATGQLYGYSDTTDTLYTVDTTTGGLTALPGAVEGTTNSNLVGFDFNPVVDRIRVVTPAAAAGGAGGAESVVLTPTSSAPFSTGPGLTYSAGDPGASSPFGVQVIEAAYTNNFAGAASTTLYGIDYGTSSLVTINVTTGAVSTVGSLGITLPTPANGTPFVGFDIFTALGGGNTAYAILDTTTGLASGTAPNFFTINLTTGVASASLGRVGGANGPNQVYSLAVTNAAVSTAAPEPGSAALFAMAATLPIAGLVRRRRRTHTSND